MEESRSARMWRKKVPVTIYMEPHQSEGLERLAVETRVTQSVYVREGIDLVLDKREAEMRAKGVR